MYFVLDPCQNPVPKEMHDFEDIWKDSAIYLIVYSAEANRGRSNNIVIMEEQ